MGDAGRDLVLLGSRLDGAAVDRLAALAARLAERGHRARVVCEAAPGFLPPDLDLTRGPGLGRGWLRPWAIRSLSRGPRPALIHAFDLDSADPALAMADRWACPYIQGVGEFLPPGGRLRVSRRWCRAVVAASPALAEDLVKAAGVPRRLVRVVRPGWPPSPPSDQEAPTAMARRVPVVGAAGPPGTVAGLASFLHACRILVGDGHDVEFVLAPGSAAEPTLRQLAANLGLLDRLTFAHQGVGPGTFWRALDVFVLATVGPTTGRELATALSHGVPAIAPAVRGLEELLIPGVTGLHVPPGDPATLASTIANLLADPILRRAMAVSSPARIAAEFGPDREADALAELYRDAGDPEPGRLLRADAARPVAG